MQIDSALVWFRRDLRIADHAALYHALKAARRVYCAFVFDREILDALPSRADRRVEFIHACLVELDAALRKHGGALIVLQGHATKEIALLAKSLKVDAVFINHDYEPAANVRDATVAGALKSSGIAWHSFKDQVLFEKDEILTGSGTFYSVFTPYKNAVLKKLDAFYLKSYPVEPYLAHLAQAPKQAPIPSLEHIGFETTNLAQLGIPTGASGAHTLFDDFK